MTKKTNITTKEKITILQKKFGRKELSFGCGVIVDSVTKTRIIGIEFPLLLKKNIKNDEPYYRLTCHDNLFTEKQFEILGHPLTLSDILKSCREIYLARPIKSYSIPSCLLIMDRINTHPRAEWNLSHNLLRDQREETIDFIYSLLTTLK